MSTASERKTLTEMALDEWGTVSEILADRGEVWPDTDISRWGPGLMMAMERAKALAAACKVVGVAEAADIGRLADLYEARTRS
ncbi:hypothetical protein [Nocardiopsis sp. YSL2]|uniref:hypothetical protein n=1 Tax=Nocardiopsis sp. YSL2 TaxID=2939492 RepID=UPI0026F4332B|nr:hypothetical protein [Nocardiopsis sp. YSL2]